MRASSVPRIMCCPASAKAPEIEIDPTTPEARMGSAVHEALKKYITGNYDMELDSYLLSLASKYELDDSDELARLFWSGVRAWKELRERVELSAIEERVSFGRGARRITGTADLIGYTRDGNRRLVIVDWKSGYVERNYRDQLLAYFLASSKKHRHELNKDERGVIVTVWLRFGFVDPVSVGPEDLDDFRERLDRTVSSEEYVPGEHCDFCPLRFQCPARTKLIRSAVTDLEATVDAKKPLKAGDFAKLYPKAKVLQKALERFDSALKDWIKANGPIPLEDERVLGFEEREKKVLSVADGFQVLQDTFSDLYTDPVDVIKFLGGGGALELKKGALEKLVAAKAERGQKGPAKANLIGRLEKAGAVTIKKYNQLVPRKVKDGEPVKF